MAPLLAATLSTAPAAVHAQTLLTGSSGQITFETDTVAGNTPGAAPNFDPVTLDLISPGQGYSNAGAPLVLSAQTPVLPLVPNLFLAQGAAPGVNPQFGGGSGNVFATNNGIFGNLLSLGDINNAALTPASTSIFDFSGSFTTGALGFSGLAGSYLGLGGFIPNPQPGSYLAAGLDIVMTANPNIPALSQTFESRIWLGFDGNGGLPDFINADGVNSPLPGGGAAIQPTVTTAFLPNFFGNNSFAAAASVVTTANFAPGTQFTVDGTLTLIADLGPALIAGAQPLTGGPNPPSISPGLFPADESLFPSVPLPNFGNSDDPSFSAPEPGALSLMLGAILPFGAVTVRRRRRARIA